MKFIYADTLDYVDPRYDFVEDRSPTDRELYWDDVFPHELLGYAPYDGLLVSRSAVGNDYGDRKIYACANNALSQGLGRANFCGIGNQIIQVPSFLEIVEHSRITSARCPPYTAEDIVDFLW